MKKIFSMFLSLVVVVSSIIALPAVSAAEASIPASGYKFTDIASNGKGAYVAMAKPDDLSKAQLYYSNDKGITWQASSSQPLASNATIYSNKPSQQQLVWWEDKGIFVAHGGASTYTSPDGADWTENANLHWTTNTMLTTSGDQLIFGGQDSANATSDLTAKQFAAHKFSLGTTDYYSPAVAAKPAAGDGNIAIFILGSYRAFDLTLKISGDTYEWTKVSDKSGDQFSSMPYDMIYAKAADQFLAVDGTETFFAARSAEEFYKATVKAGVNVTGITANDRYIVAGMSDGSMFYTNNTPEGIGNGTVWTEIPPAAGAAAGSEAIKNIEFADNENFIALGATQIYKGSINGYCNVKEYVEIGEPVIAAQNVFDGVRLIGGTYSPTLNKYLVYGDTTTPDAENKLWGKIYTSTNGTDWENVYTGFTFSARNLDTDGVTVKSHTEVRNGAVWWESEGKFIVSASTKEHSGITLVSEDGVTWKDIKPTGNNPASLDTDFRLNTDIAIAGNNLYTTNNGRQFRKYTAWNKDAMSFVGVTNVSESWYMNQIAVSDDADPAVLMAQNANGAVRNNESAAAEELGKWTPVSALGGAGALTDAVFSKNLNKFVTVLTTGLRTSIVGKDGAVVQGPVVAGGKVCNAIDTNDNTFMFACQDGNVYTAPDTADFQTASLTQVPAAAAVEVENTMNVTNVFKAGDKFIATASDNMDSDVLVIGKNGGGTYEYIKVSENGRLDQLESGQTLNIRVSGINNTDSDYTFELITAIYSGERLVQIQSGSKTLAPGSAQKVTEPFTVIDDLPQDAVMKIYRWNSAEGMVPIGEPTSPF